MTKRVYSLDVFKLCLACVIALFHCQILVSPGPTATVQIFFVCSGFFLGKKYAERSRSGGQYHPWQYTIDHAKALYPHYIFSALVLFLYVMARAVLVYVGAPSPENFEVICSTIYDFLPDIFLVQSIFTCCKGGNYPAWQLSAVLVVGFFLYALLCSDEKKARTLVLPLIFLGGLSVMRSGVDLWQHYGPLSIPLLRACYAMSLGILLFFFTESKLYSALCGKWLDIAAFACLLLLLRYEEKEEIFYIPTALILLACWNPRSIYNRLSSWQGFAWCGRLSLAIYLNHALVARVTQALLLPRLAQRGIILSPLPLGAMYLAILFAYSFCTLLLVKKLTAWASARISAGKAIAVS